MALMAEHLIVRMFYLKLEFLKFLNRIVYSVLEKLLVVNATKYMFLFKNCYFKNQKMQHKLIKTKSHRLKFYFN